MEGAGRIEDILWMPSTCLIRMIVGAILRPCSRLEREGCWMRKRRTRCSFLQVNALGKIDTNERLLSVDLRCIDIAHFGRSGVVVGEARKPRG